MDVGTGKEPPAVLTALPHHLIDVIDPDEPWSLAQYRDLANSCIDRVNHHDDLPFLVGGTGLYIQSVVEGLSIPDVPPQLLLRQELELRAATRGSQALHDELRVLDPDGADRIDHRNVRRVIRALEVVQVTGIPFSHHLTRSPRRIPPLWIGLNPPRPQLHALAAARVGSMFDHGFVDEVRVLLQRYEPSLPAFSAVGYREVAAYLAGAVGMDETVEAVIRSTRQYQRRQLTWFRSVSAMHWLDPLAPDCTAAAAALVEQYLEQYG